MIGRKTIPWRTVGIALPLACALAIPGSTAAVPTDISDLDASPVRGVDTPATPSLWDPPASPAPVVVSPPQQRKAEQRQADPARAASANPLWAIPLATLSNTRERPVFSPSRRPPPSAAASVAVAKAPPAPLPPPQRAERPDLALVGTIAGSEQSIGIFVNQTTKAALRLKIGEEYQGWRLRAVQAREVTLEHDRQTAILSLPQPGTSAPAAVRMQAENTSVPPEAEPRHGHQH
jgi:hypothetical protein